MLEEKKYEQIEVDGSVLSESRQKKSGDGNKPGTKRQKQSQSRSPMNNTISTISISIKVPGRKGAVNLLSKNSTEQGHPLTSVYGYSEESLVSENHEIGIKGRIRR